MKLPINIHDLLNARTVEWERLEFKSGWNPKVVLHTLCAFANDFHNLGGGYIILGVKEDKGRPVLPPSGLSLDQIDAIQKEIVDMGYRMIPYYHPIIAPCEVGGKHILVLWASGGMTRPYKAPVSLAKKEREFAYYIRKGSVTVRARNQDETELMSLAATVPFDDRINQRTTLDDLDLGLIRAYLKQVRSDLFRESDKMDFSRLCRQMSIVDGPAESLWPKNVGLMFFNEDPSRFFPQTQIDVVHFPEGPAADSFTEKIFKGPLHVMLQEALSHIRAMFIEEKVIKYPDRAEADRFFNYPFAAIEEALCNAIYHRSYEIREPVEVRIMPDCITIGSFPGPDRSIREQDMREFRFLSRRYRNRRVGEFLKELEMTEGRGTGIPKIMREIQKNGSPAPIFHTDDDRTFFLVEFPIHPVFSDALKTTPEVTVEVTVEVTMEVRKLLRAMNGEHTRRELQEMLRLKNADHFRKAYLLLAIETGVVEMTLPDKPNSRLQKYRLTENGWALKRLLKEAIRAET
ncbi:MAG: putative DNA binding domain-containing protein [Deltaproteobacteria bacterium]|nr:putative DNA binding domain-containing protein [Deltaproteobacteria bacterium]